MYWHSNRHSDSKAPFIIILLHVLITQGIYQTNKLLQSLSPFSIYYWYFPNRSVFSLVIISYIRVAYRNPGFISNITPQPHVTEHPQENNAEVTISKPQNRVKHLSTENDENYEKEKDNTKQAAVPKQVIEEPAILETRFCTVCFLEQPLRAKHCRECGKCVALHDHHCPWLGICIGEKNRFYFWWYLLFECILLWTSAVIVSMSIEEIRGLEWFKWNLIKVFMVVVISFFILMVTCLLCYHSYLALVNQTTWENVSWEKISYLKRFPKKMGSPFSKGVFWNLWFYCWKRLPVSYTPWVVSKPNIV